MALTPGSSQVASPAGTSSNALLAPQVALVLKVTHGRTRFRERPVTGARFLIGADPACDLRLGGTSMPALHSIVTVAGGDVTIESISREPALVVNGRRASSVTLKHGDVIQIGDVELVSHITAVPLGTAASVPARPIADDDVPPLEDLSAAELISLIEDEQAEVEKFEERQRLGADALMHTLRSISRLSPKKHFLHAGTAGEARGPHFPVELPEQSDKSRTLKWAPAESTEGSRLDEEFLNDLKQIGQTLAAFSQELQARTSDSGRAASYESAATALLEAQRKIVSQLELLLEQVATLQGSQRGADVHSRDRAIA